MPRAAARGDAAPSGLPAARPPGEPLTVPTRVLADVAAALAAARAETDVAAAGLPLLMARPGVRAAAVVARRGRAAVVLASAGYECGSMATGTALPLDAALPVTECVRTGRLVVQGTGPAWVALPLGGGLQGPGALLLSLTSPPPEPEHLERLERLSRVLGEALRRAAGQDADTALLATVSDRLRSAPVLHPTAGVELAVRTLPLSGSAGGDVAAGLPGPDGGCWLIVADVCGNGAAAAVLAAGVRAAVRACAPLSDGPAALLGAVERAVADDVGPGLFVTAVAVLVDADGRARVSSAGHPPPLLVRDGRAVHAAVEPGPPLALEGGERLPLPEAPLELTAGTVLLLHTDGLLERRAGSTLTVLDPALLAAALPASLEEAADLVLARAARTGAAHDDVSVLLARRA